MDYRFDRICCDNCLIFISYFYLAFGLQLKGSKFLVFEMSLFIFT